MAQLHDVDVAPHPTDAAAHALGASIPPRTAASMSAGTAALLGVFGIIGAVITGFALGGGAFTRLPNPQLPPPPAPAAPAAPASAATTKLDVTSREFAFSPAKLAMDKPGQLVVNLTNAGVVEHDLTITGITGKAYAAPGGKGSATFDRPKAGTYQVICSIPGHKEAGMVGTLVVNAGTAAAKAPAAAPADVKPAAPAPAAPVTAPASDPPAPAIKPAMTGLTPLPAPQVAAPIGARAETVVKVELEAREVNAVLADGITCTFWTLGGTVPGPMLRVRQGDTVELTFKNAPASHATHSIDLHAVTGQGGGAACTQAAPGTDGVFRFKAMNPGVHVYHCATPMVAHHISNGMYGLIVVEPPGGLTPVDREYYVMQGDFYLEGDRGQPGHQGFAVNKMLDEIPTYVLFNGGVGSLTGKNALKAKVDERVRIFFGVGGPNLTSSFHVIGEIFDRIQPEGASEFQTNVQTTLVPAGGATVAEFTADVPGTLIIVDHSLGRLEKGAAAQIVVEGAAKPEIFEAIKVGKGGTGGH
jgi:nitrite reductase (NO-forming)